MCPDDGKEHPVIGKVFQTEAGDLIHIDSGQYEVNGRISNFWYWRKVTKSGSLSKKQECGYLPRMYPVKCNIRIHVEVVNPSR